MLDIIEISKSYGDFKALNNISLKINKGDILGLLGINGAGKSTLINILSCITESDSGAVFWDKKNIKTNIDEYKRKIGVVPQEIALYQELSAIENLNFWGSLYDISPLALKEKVNHVLNLFGLYDRRNQKIKTYSGGMKRKINIACSTLHNPSLLLMDEPTVGLDPQSRYDVLELIENLNSTGMTIVYTTHYMEIAERICNKIAIIDEGKILAHGHISDLQMASGIKDSITIKLKSVDCLVLENLNMSFSSYKIDNALNTFYTECSNINNDISEIINSIQNCNGEILSIETNVTDLERVFVQLTGKILRD